MNALDADYLDRAAPPGSMRHFALQYASTEYRDAVAALFVIDAEIRASATQVAHEVTHTRLQWWRSEVDRLINRNAQHPATKTLQAALPHADYSLLHELLVATDMDVAGMTYNNASELNAYLQRSGGVIWQLAANADDAANQQARQLGSWIRRVETLRDLVVDARAARIYWPLEELESRQITLEELRSGKSSEKLRALLATETECLNQTLRDLVTNAVKFKTSTVMRPLFVLTTLHSKLLDQIALAQFDVFTQRHELPPLKKVWTAWRAARRA